MIRIFCNIVQIMGDQDDCQIIVFLQIGHRFVEKFHTVLIDS